jgi:hypothetical protein
MSSMLGAQDEQKYCASLPFIQLSHARHRGGNSQSTSPSNRSARAGDAASFIWRIILRRTEGGQVSTQSPEARGERCRKLRTSRFEPNTPPEAIEAANDA